MNVSRWSASHFSDAANALNIPPGEYGRKGKTQRELDRGDPRNKSGGKPMWVKIPKRITAERNP